MQQIWDYRGQQASGKAQAKLVPGGGLQAGGPPIGVSPEREGISPARQEIIPPVIGGIEGDLQVGDPHSILPFLLRKQVQRLVMELQMPQWAGFWRFTPPPFPKSRSALHTGDVLMANVPPTQEGMWRCETRLGIP